MLALSIYSGLLSALAIWYAWRFDKERRTSYTLRLEISRVQQIAMRERLALGDYITFHGGDIRDAPHMTAEELAVAVRREYEEVCTTVKDEELRWLYVTMFCLNMVCADSRVYLNAETREKARELQARKFKAAEAEGTKAPDAKNT